MSGFTESLGIKPGDSVVVLDDGNTIFRRLSIEAPEDVALQKRVLGDRVEMIIVRIGEGQDTGQLFKRIQQGIKPDGVIWAVSHANNAELLAGALEAGLIETDTISFSEEEVGVRFVREEKHR
ncbi:MAG: hypothetical protein IIB39_07080 [Candidatus Marinimicrobia bacterium]|nr:hypothetical protein [Candidatus Neomarinimicrobiota bacterium]